MIWVLGLIGVAGVAWLWRKGMEPAANDLAHPSSLAHTLQLLLSRGVHNGTVRGTVTVRLRTADYPRLVFWKYIRENGDVGVHAVFAREEWSAPYYDRFRSELTRRGIAHAETEQPPGPGLSIDFGRDFGLALVTTQALFQDVVGASVARDCVAFFRDVLIHNHPRLTGVDSPNDGWG